VFQQVLVLLTSSPDVFRFISADNTHIGYFSEA